MRRVACIPFRSLISCFAVKYFVNLFLQIERRVPRPVAKFESHAVLSESELYLERFLRFCISQPESRISLQARDIGFQALTKTMSTIRKKQA